MCVCVYVCVCVCGWVCVCGGGGCYTNVWAVLLLGYFSSGTTMTNDYNRPGDLKLCAYVCVHVCVCVCVCVFMHYVEVWLSSNYRLLSG